ncbi:hypothetical protein [Amycolatopsis sp. NPDC059657]|uniref:hypothetical protein n=1 Tax=Amycolatopsis sp. NPDC059657 TaxID=3346899 RepID=UPI003671B12A
MTNTHPTHTPADRGEPGAPLARARRDRVILTPPADRHRPWRGRRPRGAWVAAVLLAGLIGGAFAVQASAADPTAHTAAARQLLLPAQPAPNPPLPLPTGPTSTCAPNSPDPTCHFPTVTSTPSVPVSPLPPITELPTTSCFPGQVGCTPATTRTSPSTPPCTGEGCIPQPTTAPPSSGIQPGEPGAGGGDPECGITNISGCINAAINAVFRDLVKAAMDPVLKLLGDTAFSTPTLDSLPGMANLWNNSWLIVLAAFGGLVMIGGIVVMAHESIQSRYSIKEIAPRLVVSFIASTLSLFVIDKVIRLANALSAAVLGDGVDPPKLGNTLAESVNGAYSAAVSGGLFVIILHLVLVIAVIALLLVYVVRVIILLILTASAPLWVACHALPHTDGIARWCERALVATLGIQVAQALTLIVALNTFLSGSVHLFNSVGGGLVMLFAVLGLLYILFKIPFWLLSATKLGTGRSFLGGLVKAVIAAKTFGAIAGKAGGFGKARALGVAQAGRRHGGGGRGGAADPPWPPQPRIAPTPDAVNKRLRQQYDAERERAARQPMLPSQEPRFLQPGPQETSHDPARTPAVPVRPGPPEFSSGPRPAGTAPPAFRHRPQPGSAPKFQSPGGPRSGKPPALPIRVASVPPQLRFQPASPEPAHTSRPVTRSAPQPAAPVFRAARPEPRLGDALPRTQSVPPVAFRPPAPPTTRGDAEK